MAYSLRKVDDLAIPPKWAIDYPHIFFKPDVVPAPSLLVMPSEPVLLTEVIVAALSSHAYQVACSDSVLETWFSSENLILRHGAVYDLTAGQLQPNSIPPAPQKSVQYRIDMVLPVLQGFARKGHTKFIITLSEPSRPSAVTAVPNEIDNEIEGIEIGEAFLANSALSPVFGSAENPSHSLLDGASIPHRTSPSESFFQICALWHPIEPQTDSFTLYMRTADLSRVGMLNGDWVS